MPPVIEQSLFLFLEKTLKSRLADDVLGLNYLQQGVIYDPNPAPCIYRQNNNPEDEEEEVRAGGQ